MVDFQTRCGYMPTVRETMQAFGMASTNGPRCHLVILAAHGYVVRAGGRGYARTLCVTPAGYKAVAA